MNTQNSSSPPDLTAPQEDMHKPIRPKRSARKAKKLTPEAAMIITGIITTVTPAALEFLKWLFRGH